MLDDLLQAIVDHPQEEARYAVLGDYLEEYDDPRRAELLRLHRLLLAASCETNRPIERLTWQRRIMHLLTEGVRPCIPQKTIFLGKQEKIPMRFVYIPSGSFLMGNDPEAMGHEATEMLRQVDFKQGFWMGVHQVTQQQWKWATGETPSFFQSENHPVESVSYLDCQHFMEKLGQKIEMGVRLPVETEWEYACRAGTMTPFYFGEHLLLNQASFDGNYTHLTRNRTTPVGRFPPNAWGLFDMHGNVWEWCLPCKYPQYANNGPPCIPSHHDLVLRGGSWVSHSMSCRASSRLRVGPGYCSDDGGCRIVLSLNSTHLITAEVGIEQTVGAHLIRSA